MGQFGWYSVNAKRSIPILLGAMAGGSTWGGGRRDDMKKIFRVDLNDSAVGFKNLSVYPRACIGSQKVNDVGNVFWSPKAF